MPIVAICTPHGAQAFPDYYRALMEMQLQWTQHTFYHVEIDTMIVSKARNALVQASRDTKCDVVWFIDNDTLVPKDAGILVEQALQLQVVSGVYFNRRPPYPPQVYECADDDGYTGMYWPLLNYPESGLRQEDAIGAGCVCIRMDAFAKLEEAWKPRVAKAASEITDAPIKFIVENLSPWFEFLEKKGEDMYLSERCKEAGIPIWVNWDIKCDHIGYARYSEAHFTSLRDSGKIIKIDEKAEAK